MNSILLALKVEKKFFAQLEMSSLHCKCKFRLIPKEVEGQYR